MWVSVGSRWGMLGREGEYDSITDIESLVASKDSGFHSK